MPYHPRHFCRGLIEACQLKAVRYQENVELEFKGKANPNVGELNKDDRKNLGITLSAFSNSMGGVLIWGVVAAKGDDDVDCASELQPIAQIERFKSDVERAVSQVLMPRHEGIRVALIRCADRPGSGYLALHVERSERRPHRCEVAGEKQCFKRIGDSSVAMEHYDIEDSFKRLVVPKLDVSVEIKSGGSIREPTRERLTAAIRLSLVNNSPSVLAFHIC